MIYRFEILTEENVYEGWAHTPEEMSEKFSAEYPNVDHEVFPNRNKLCSINAPKMLTLSEYRTYCASGLSDRKIMEIDQLQFTLYAE